MQSPIRLMAAATFVLAACSSQAGVTPKNAYPTPPPPAMVPPTIEAYTASAAAFYVGSYAVMSDGEILLIDAQMVQPEAEALIAKLRGLPGRLTTIYITHPHPDHYLGLQWIVEAFPEAKVLASPDTVAEIAAKGEATLAFLRSDQWMNGTLAPIAPTRVVVPQPWTESTLPIGNTQLEIHRFVGAESSTADVLYEPATRSLFTGDLASNKVHLWLRDTTTARWIPALDQLRALGAATVYPGHGEPGPATLLDASRTYLAAFEEELAHATSSDDLAHRVKARFPSLQAPAIVDLAAPARFESR